TPEAPAETPGVAVKKPGSRPRGSVAKSAVAKANEKPAPVRPKADVPRPPDRSAMAQVKPGNPLSDKGSGTPGPVVAQAPPKKKDFSTSLQVVKGAVDKSAQPDPVGVVEKPAKGPDPGSELAAPNAPTADLEMFKIEGLSLILPLRELDAEKQG